MPIVDGIVFALLLSAVKGVKEVSAVYVRVRGSADGVRLKAYRLSADGVRAMDVSAT